MDGSSIFHTTGSIKMNVERQIFIYYKLLDSNDCFIFKGWEEMQIKKLEWMMH